jgi:hypothetical protein
MRRRLDEDTLALNSRRTPPRIRLMDTSLPAEIDGHASKTPRATAERKQERRVAMPTIPP